VNVSDLLGEYDSAPDEGWMLVKWRTVSFNVLTRSYSECLFFPPISSPFFLLSSLLSDYGIWAYSTAAIEGGILVGWVASEIQNSVIGFILQSMSIFSAILP
jgi:hypothetical protein